MVSNSIAKVHGIESKSEADGLPDKVEKLSYVRALFAVAVRCVGVTGCRDDLETESFNAYGEFSLEGERVQRVT